MKERQASYAGLLVLSAIDLLTVALVAGIYLFLVLSIDPPGNLAAAHSVKANKQAEIVLQIASSQLIAEHAPGVEVLVKSSAIEPRYLLGVAPGVTAVRLNSQGTISVAVALLPKIGLPKKGWTVACEVGLQTVDLSVSPIFDVKTKCLPAAAKCRVAKIPIYGPSELLALGDDGTRRLCLVSERQKAEVACKEGIRTKLGNVFYRFEEADYKFDPGNPSRDVQLARSGGDFVCEDDVARRVIDQ